MRYENITKGRFISRPNRFIAYVDIGGAEERVHVKNTGRCGELLVDGAQVYLEKSGNNSRSTAYDLVAVKKGDRLINMDSNAPNKAVGEWLLKKELFPGLKYMQPEKTYGKSRLDFYVETEDKKIFLEVKGVTLERENVMYFPDAPSERAVKHVEELIHAVQEGYEAYLLFVVQMKGVDRFEPNRETQPVFAEALLKAREAGVKLIARDCIVTTDSMDIADEVTVVLSELDRIAKPLLDWYDRGRRVLPWRENPVPYFVWLSEIMLQQTRVEAVKPYFDRFVSEVPDIESLAEIEEERLMKLWEGLGYYNRARNLKKSARKIMEEYDGQMPSAYEELLELPGVGSYTAGAIASIAYGQAVPAVDGNVLRVLSRLRMDGEDILSQKTKVRVQQELQTVIPPERPGDFNQALMELGAMVCLPNGMPKCEVCPWSGFCKAHEEDRISEFPKKKAKKARTIEEKTVLVIRDEDRIFFRRRPDRGLLAGMYEFPMLDGYRTENEVLSYLNDIGFQVLRIQSIEDAKHIFSHKEWHMRGYVIRVDEWNMPAEKARASGFLSIDRKEASERYPIPSAYAAYKKYLNRKQ